MSVIKSFDYGFNCLHVGRWCPGCFLLHGHAIGVEPGEHSGQCQKDSRPQNILKKAASHLEVRSMPLLPQAPARQDERAQTCNGGKPQQEIDQRTDDERQLHYGSPDLTTRLIQPPVRSESSTR